jgi:hypothetical protein
VDQLFRAESTVVEVDGKVKYADPNVDPREVLWQEKLREDRIRGEGWQVVRLTWAHLQGSRQELRARMLTAFALGSRATA